MTVQPAPVYLIGAGPGAADLLTLRAARVLALADVVLVDDLVDAAVLAHCRTEARIIGVGKRAGCRSTAQSFIQRLMCRYAKQGRVVARLKGGDAFVFGRGGEELEHLLRRGIRVEVVPGLTAGVAVPAALGIPVTQRGLSHGVTFVTGHSCSGVDPDWAALARTGTTLVIYMGLGRIEHIVQSLIAGGMRADVPTVVIAHGTLPGERHVVAPLAHVASAAQAACLPAPALIVVGEVVAFAQTRIDPVSRFGPAAAAG